MEKLSIKDIDLKGKRVLMRVDFNVPLEENLKISDDTRIRATLPSIEYILTQGAKLILISHLGRPKGKVVESLRLEPVAKRLEILLNKKVLKLDDCVGEEVKNKLSQLKEKDIALLENLRFHEEEKENSEGFARALASLGDIFVNDAFGAAHRAHASVVGVAKFLPAYAGFLLEKEIEYLSKAAKNPAKPYIVILGGAKVADKIGVIQNLLDKCSSILIGGGMAYTFLKAQGIEVGSSKLEPERIELAREILSNAKDKNVDILLPVDHLVVTDIDTPQTSKVVEEGIPQGLMGVDIGPQTIDLFKSRLNTAKTVLWNGPLGIFEKEPYSKGTEEIAKFLANSNATTIIGGGDTASAVSKFKLETKMTHVSTGGGASLEYLEGKTLPGIAVLKDK